MSVTRITGITSGIDTDMIIKKLMDSEQVKIDNLKASKQYAVWEQEAYRDTISKLDTFQLNNLDLTNTSTNITSPTFFASFSSDVSVNSTDVSYLTATGTSDITDFTHTVSSITQLATKDKYESASQGFNQILSGDLVTDFATNKPAIFKTSLTIDGTSKTISIDMSAIDNITDFTTALNSEIGTQFGSDFNSIASVSGNNIKFASPGNDLTLLSITGEEASMTWLGVSSGESTTSYSSKSLNDLFGIVDADLTTMTVNGTSLSSLGVSQTTTVSDLMDLVNGASLDAKMTYSPLDDKFNIESTSEGSSNDMTLSADFTSKLKFDTGVHTSGLNAKLNIDGVDVTKSSNTFTLDGVLYTLKDTYSGVDPIDISVSKDTDGLYTKIKNFVDAYNTLIKDLSDKYSEEKFSDYKPLTDDQKKDMTQEEIDKWEEKAKSGSLKGKSELSSILSKMRTAMYDTVTNAGISLYEIGITTSSNYQDEGKLVIDETKLKSNLENNYSKIVKLFTNSSDKAYLDSANATERYNESGLGYRLQDIIKDNIRITRDSNNLKGILVEKSGISDISPNATNIIGKQIIEYDSRITDLLALFQDKEDHYYEQFGKMEAALSEMQSQSSSLMSQMG
ncbi:flagellar filament capping protein FliD [Helicovermis profundi]|uniref:Flagellar hook-associated protein 2 n=1 Tax=Helicovermis profundi TaxID=3065157 RepID=A0AAU9E651_9FIRM|nr:flagellar filament capping protein FliD [Clostridia bacterium S502]